jgi:hypothetical protein
MLEYNEMAVLSLRKAFVNKELKLYLQEEVGKSL